MKRTRRWSARILRADRRHPCLRGGFMNKDAAKDAREPHARMHTLHHGHQRFTDEGSSKLSNNSPAVRFKVGCTT